MTDKISSLRMQKRGFRTVFFQSNWSDLSDRLQRSSVVKLGGAIAHSGKVVYNPTIWCPGISAFSTRADEVTI